MRFTDTDTWESDDPFEILTHTINRGNMDGASLARELQDLIEAEGINVSLDGPILSKLKRPGSALHKYLLMVVGIILTQERDYLLEWLAAKRGKLLVDVRPEDKGRDQ